MKKLLLLIFFVQSALCLTAQIRLSAFFSNSMVLQRNQRIPLWGWAAPNEKITVQFHTQTLKTKTGKDGKWHINLAEESAGGPYTLTVKGKTTIIINDVLVGEVWIASGQSNMEMKIGDWGFINNYKQEIADANYPQIRQFEVPKNTAAHPLQDVTGGDWKLCTPQNAALFSAAAYFFARDLYKQLKVPIGIINTTWGGTHVETWTSKEALESSTEFKDMIAAMKKTDIKDLIQQRREKAEKRLQQLRAGAAPAKEELALWKENSYDDSKWNTMNLPGLWEQQGLEDFDGFVWFRKTILVKEEDAGKAAEISLAMMDDNDETYLNGIKIGATAGYNIVRKYSVSAGILKAGKNVIAVRVEDTGGGGGVWGDATEMKYTIAEKEESLAGKWLFNIESSKPGATSLDPNSFPTLLFNAMINPLIPYGIKGVIWYQGEANAGRAYQYRTAFPLMITDWRTHWQQGDFPFYFVQLASWNANNGNSNKGSEWAELREAQAMSLSLPNTGMAVTTDIGDAIDIHPKNKQDVGKRLAAPAISKPFI